MEIKYLENGDLLKLSNGNYAIVEEIYTDSTWYDDIARVFDVNTNREGLLYNTDSFERVVGYEVLYNYHERVKR